MDGMDADGPGGGENNDGTGSLAMAPSHLQPKSRHHAAAPDESDAVIRGKRSGCGRGGAGDAR